MKEKILFLMNPMQGYAEEIKKVFENKGYIVTHEKDACRINKSSLTLKEKVIKSLAKDFKFYFFRKKYEKIEDIFFKKKVENYKEEFDYIIDFAAGSNPRYMNVIKERYPQINKKLFIWDDLDYHEESKELIPYFDKVYTYNKYDADKNNLKYRPSFFLECFNYNNEQKEIGFFYVATMREIKRAKFATELDKKFKELNNHIKLIHKLKIKDYFFKRKLLSFKEYYDTRILNVLELANYYKKSKVLLDISFTGQKGLGLRPIEALASKCKLITTNEDIKTYDFYNENNIFIVNSKNMEEIRLFLEKPYKEIKEDIIKNYTIDKFIDELMEKE